MGRVSVLGSWSSRAVAWMCALVLVLAGLPALLVATERAAGALPPASTWTEVSPTPATATNTPSSRSGASMAFDAASGNVVLFGGQQASFFRSAETWVWDGSTWTQKTPSTSPPARDGAAMAFDAGSGNVVLFGGMDDGGINLGDTWVWDGSDWTQKTPVTSPPARSGASMAFDAASGNVVLFGGRVSPGLSAQTWVWDGSDWALQSPSASPSAREKSAMSFDAASGNVVLFGGNENGVAKADTWVWDGSDWALQSPSASPPARFGASMTFDAESGNVVLFGGDGFGPRYDDTWTWDGSDWTQQAPAASASPRVFAAMAFDEAHGDVVLFGGTGGSGKLADTWTYAPPPPVTYGWTDVSPSPATSTNTPAARVAASIAYDAASGNAVLFGGNTGLSVLGDTWVWDGSTWSDVTPTSPGVSPSAREGASVVFDAASGEVVLFGGREIAGVMNDMWVWNGSTWIDVTPSQLPAEWPSAREGASMVFDAASGNVVMFGGATVAGVSYSNQTWLWDGSAWTDVTPVGTSPSARSGASMAFDARSGTTVLFGGGTGPGALAGDTWAWDGATWIDVTPVSPGVSPPERITASMVFDAGSGNVVLFGGFGSAALADTWVWGPVDPPPPVPGTVTVITSDQVDPSFAGFFYVVSGTVTVDGTGPASGNLPGQVVISGDGAGCTDSTLTPTLTANVFGFSCMVIGASTGSKSLVADYSDPGSAYGSSTSGVESHEVVDAPPPPTNVTVNLSGTTGVVNAAPPVSGPTPTGYQVRCMPVGVAEDTSPNVNPSVRFTGGASLPITVTGLTRGKTYHCKVRARYGVNFATEAGDYYEGPLSSWSAKFTVPVAIPAAPTRVTATAPALPGGQATTLSWVWGPNQTGAPVTFSSRCVSPNGGTTRTATGGSPVVIGSLSRGATYACSVRATNSAGSSAWVAAPNIVVPPNAPTNVVASTPTATRSTRVSFTAGPGGPPITTFSARCASTNGGATRNGTAAASPITVTGLSAGKSYRCTVNPVYGTTAGLVSNPSNLITAP